MDRGNVSVSKDSTFKKQVSGAAQLSINELITILDATINITTDAIGFINLIPDTYKILKNLLTFGVKYNLIQGHGFIYDIASDKEFLKNVKDIELHVLGQLPEDFQRILYL